MNGRQGSSPILAGTADLVGTATTPAANVVACATTALRIHHTVLSKPARACSVAPHAVRRIRPALLRLGATGATAGQALPTKRRTSVPGRRLSDGVVRRRVDFGPVSVSAHGRFVFTIPTILPTSARCVAYRGCNVFIVVPAVAVLRSTPRVCIVLVLWAARRAALLDIVPDVAFRQRGKPSFARTRASAKLFLAICSRTAVPAWVGGTPILTSEAHRTWIPKATKTNLVADTPIFTGLAVHMVVCPPERHRIAEG